MCRDEQCPSSTFKRYPSVADASAREKAFTPGASMRRKFSTLEGQEGSEGVGGGQDSGLSLRISYVGGECVVERWCVQADCPGDRRPTSASIQIFYRPSLSVTGCVCPSLPIPACSCLSLPISLPIPCHLGVAGLVGRGAVGVDGGWDTTRLARKG